MTIEEALNIDYPLDPYYRFRLNLIFTAGKLDERSQKALRNFGLTLPQFNVLRILRAQQPKSLSISEIQQRMLHKTSNVTRLVEKLLEKELLVKKECDHNRRKLDITISKKGLRLLKKTDALIETHLEILRSAITVEEAERISQILTELRQKFLIQ